MKTNTRIRNIEQRFITEIETNYERLNKSGDNEIIDGYPNMTLGMSVYILYMYKY